PPAVAVAVNVTGLPLSPAAVARSVSTLAAVPRVQEFAAAIPFAPVATGVAGSTVPLSPLVANVTATPGTGLANWSRTITEGGVGPTLPLPPAGANVTATPATGLLNWSRTITAGGVATAVPTVAVWLLPALGAIDAAAAAVTLNGLLVTGPRPPELATSV